MRSVRTHIRSNVVGYVAVFLALSGTASALSGSNTVFSDDIVNDQVRSPDVRNDDLSGGGLAAVDLRAGSVGTSEVAQDSLTRDDLAVDSVSSSEIEDGGVDTAEVEDGGLLGIDIANNSLTGDDVDESSLGQVPAAALGGIGRSSGGGACDPESTAFVTCKSMTVNLPAPSRVLVIGRIRARSEVDASHGRGTCRVSTGATGRIAGSEAFVAAGNLGDSVAVIGVSPVIGPGTVAFGIDCNQDPLSGAITYDQAGVAAIALSPS